MGSGSGLWVVVVKVAVRVGVGVGVRIGFGVGVGVRIGVVDYWGWDCGCCRGYCPYRRCCKVDVAIMIVLVVVVVAIVAVDIVVLIVVVVTVAAGFVVADHFRGAKVRGRRNGPHVSRDCFGAIQSTTTNEKHTHAHHHQNILGVSAICYRTHNLQPPFG